MLSVIKLIAVSCALTWVAVASEAEIQVEAPHTVETFDGRDGGTQL